MLRNRRSGSVMVLFTLMLPTLLIPLVGLAIDASICRLAQTRLQAAVDGAAIGAGRLLGTTADAETVAREFIDANFRTDNSAGSWGANNLIKTDVHYTPGITKKIEVNASADVPLLFMRILGKTKATIAAGSTATRTDTRVVFVMDRSNSMNGSGSYHPIDDAKNDAAGFIQKFTSGADELGMVIFDGTAFVAYPQSNPNWDPTTTSTSRGGPNTAFNDSGDANNMVNEIGTINALGQTNTAEALWLAYIELQKAHLKDLAADGHDYRMNSIVLLTDGIPQAVSIYPNDYADKDTSTVPPTYPWNALKSTSTCTNRITAANPTPPKMLLTMAASRPFSGNYFDDSFQIAALDTTAAHTSLWWLQNGGQEYRKTTGVGSPPYIPANIDGCGSLKTGFGSTNSATQDLSRIPRRDAWGNSMEGTLYKTASDVVDTTGHSATNPLDTSLTLSATSPVTDADYWALAMWNAVDSAATRIRTDVNRPNRVPADTQDMRVTIHVIGYAGNGNLDQGLCKRIANHKGLVDATQPIGKFVLATNQTELQNGFSTIFQTILRLAK